MDDRPQIDIKGKTNARKVRQDGMPHVPGRPGIYMWLRMKRNGASLLCVHSGAR